MLNKYMHKLNVKVMLTKLASERSTETFSGLSITTINIAVGWMIKNKH